MSKKEREEAAWTEESWQENVLARERTINPLFHLPGISVQHTLKPDWMHVVDEGCAALAAGQILWSVLDEYPASTQEGRAELLWKHIQELYKASDWPKAKQLPKLTLKDFKKPKQAPELDVKAAQTRHFAPMLEKLTQSHGYHEKSLKHKAIHNVAKYCGRMYKSLEAGSPEFVAKHGYKFITQYLALEEAIQEERPDDIQIWRARPKFHLLQHILDKACKGFNPKDSWNYRDETFAYEVQSLWFKGAGKATSPGMRAFEFFLKWMNATPFLSLYEARYDPMWKPTEVLGGKTSDGAWATMKAKAYPVRMNEILAKVHWDYIQCTERRMMNSFLSSLEQNPFARCHFQRRELCRSIGQLPVPLLVIGEGVNAPGETNTEQPKDVEAKETEIKEAKSAVVIIARQHPGEVVGSWAVQGLLRFLLGTTPAARRLREEFVFHVIPMVNVDGVVHGNSRCTLAGVDPNRVWHDPNPILHPVVFSLKNHMRSLSQGLSPDPVKGIEMFLDLHGHSAKFGCFFYGSNPSAHISNAVFPKLCSLISTDIDFEQCHWRCPKSHRKTARYVVYKQFGVKYAYTIECSLYAPVPLESGAPAGHFSPSRVEFVGCAVGCGLALFADGTEDFRLKACRQCESEEANRAESEIFRATCDTNLLLDISCPNVLAKRPWFHMERLESRDSVLESLLLTYGEVVPDMSQKLKDSDDGGDSDGDDGEDEDRRKEAAGTATATGTTGTTRTSPVGTAAPAPAVPGSSPTSARKMTSKDTQVKRPTRTLVTGDEDESPRHTPPAPPAPPAPGPSNAQITGLEGRRARVSRARSMDRFDPLQCAGPDYSIPLASNLLALESISTLSYSTFDPLWPRGELNQVASQRRDVFKERDLDVHRENNVSFSGGETPQGHLAMLCSPLCVTGVTPAADVVFDSKAFKTTAGTQSRHLSQEKLERSRAATERSERLSERLRPSGLRHPGRRSSPVDDEDNPLMLRPLQSTRRSSGPDPRRPLR
eukprot:symbB.v1.2.031233.t1/scaffold3530.1/size57246/2